MGSDKHHNKSRTKEPNRGSHQGLITLLKTLLIELPPGLHGRCPHYHPGDHRSLASADVECSLSAAPISRAVWDLIGLMVLSGVGLAAQ
jgi:hypothetical protein